MINRNEVEQNGKIFRCVLSLLEKNWIIGLVLL